MTNRISVGAVVETRGVATRALFERGVVCERIGTTCLVAPTRGVDEAVTDALVAVHYSRLDVVDEDP